MTKLRVVVAKPEPGEGLTQSGEIKIHGYRPTRAETEGRHPLVAGVGSLTLAENNSVPFALSGVGEAQVLARAGGELSVALIDYGNAGGQVLALADVGLLASDGGEPANLGFWQNLAQYALSW